MAQGFRSSLQKALAAIGRKNGHAPPTGGHNIDPVLHYFMVDSEAKSFFEAQRKVSMNELMSVLDDGKLERIEAIIAEAKRTKVKQPTASIVDTQRYVLNLDVKKPAERLDATALRNKLTRDGRYTREEISKLFEESTTENAPAKTWTVATLFD